MREGVALVAEGADPDFGVVVDRAEGVEHAPARPATQGRVIEHCHGMGVRAASVQGRVEGSEGNVALARVQLGARPHVPGHPNAVHGLGVQKLRHCDGPYAPDPSTTSPRSGTTAATRSVLPPSPIRCVSGQDRGGFAMVLRWSSDVRASERLRKLLSLCSSPAFERDDRCFARSTWVAPGVSSGDPPSEVTF